MSAPNNLDDAIRALAEKQRCVSNQLADELLGPFGFVRFTVEPEEVPSPDEAHRLLNEWDEAPPAVAPRPSPSPRRSPTVPPAPDLDAVDACVPEKLPALMAHLAALQSRAATKLLALPSAPNGSDRAPEVDETIVGVEEAAHIAHHSVSWMRKNGHTLPGFRQPRGKGTAVGWARAELTAWANGNNGVDRHT